MGFGTAYNFPGSPSLTGAVPVGYRVTTRSRDIGRGKEYFDTAREAVLHWGVHVGAGFRAVEVPDRVAVGVTSVWIVPFGPFRPRVACRVFTVVDEPHAAGFGHGALVGHPQSGWESYLVTIDHRGVVRLTIRVVWHPAARWMRALTPAVPFALHLILRRNLRALDSV
ncbi:MAG: DUF1990 domain-containing protein [Mycetocola sp.]